LRTFKTTPKQQKNSDTTFVDKNHQQPTSSHLHEQQFLTDQMQESPVNQYASIPSHSSLSGFNFSNISILNNSNIQTKLKISQPGDRYEKEADRVADQILQMPVSDSDLNSSYKESHLHQKCSNCQMKESDGEEKDKLKISRKSQSLSSPDLSGLEASSGVVNEINNKQNSGGKPLDSSTKSFMEQRFGYDFSNVKIHDDSKSKDLASVVNARAFALENNIFLGYGESVSDKKLIAHELTHLIQQNNASLNDNPPQVDSSTQIITNTKQPKIKLIHGNRIIQRSESDRALELSDSKLENQTTEIGMPDIESPLVREFIRGFVEGLITKESKARISDISVRFNSLSKDPFAMFSLYAGFGFGIYEGIKKSAKDLRDMLIMGLTLGPRIYWWLLKKELYIYKNYDKVADRVVSIWNKISQQSTELDPIISKVLKDPQTTINMVIKITENVSDAALEKVRHGGRKFSSSVLKFFELPWKEFGEKIGFVVGMILFEVMLGFATAGIGNVLTKLSTALKGGRAALGAKQTFGLIKEATVGLRKILISMRDSVVDSSRTLIDDLIRLYDEFLDITRGIGDDLLGEPALAPAGGPGKIPQQPVMMAEGRPPGRTTPTTVEELYSPERKPGGKGTREPTTKKHAGSTKSKTVVSEEGSITKKGETIETAIERSRQILATMKIPRAARLRGSSGIDPQPLLSLARDVRATQVGVSYQAFKRYNVATARVRVNGKIEYLDSGSFPSSAHSEEWIHSQIRELRKTNHVVLEQLYSERIPCHGRCGPLLSHEYPDADIFYSTTKRSDTAASELMYQYGI